MNILVLYDSVFGNTEQIAKWVYKSFCESTNPENVKIHKITDANSGQISGIDLLVVGSPTRGFRPTKPISEFLDKLPSGSLNGITSIAFDTRLSTVDVNSKLLNVLVKIFGYAAEPIARKLAKKGARQAVAPEGFFVSKSEGPLKEGELERASAWAKSAL